MKNLKKNDINIFLNKCLIGEFKFEGWQHPLGFGHIKIYDGTKQNKASLLE